MQVVLDFAKPETTRSSNDQQPRAQRRAPIDLASLATKLRQSLGSRLPPSYLEGKTRMRDEVMTILVCSAFEAERLVDALVNRGFARFERAEVGDTRFGRWTIAAR